MLHLSKKQTQTFQYARWRHQQKTYRWRKTKHVLSDNITTLKQNTKKTKRQKKHILMYLKIVNIDIIRKLKMYLNQLNYWRVTVTPFVLIRLIMPPTLLEHWDINTNVPLVNLRNLSFGCFKTQSKFRNNLF